jgi:hypothetical protein
VNGRTLSLVARRRLAVTGAALLVGWVVTLVLLSAAPERRRAANPPERPTVVVERWDGALALAPSRPPVPRPRTPATVANDSADRGAAGPLSVRPPGILALSRAWLDAMQIREARRPADRATPERLRAYRTGGGYSVDFDLRRDASRQLGQLTIRTDRGEPRVTHLELGALVRA